MTTHSPLTMKFVIPTSPAELVSKSSNPKILEKYMVQPSQRVNFSLPYMDPAIIDLQLLLDSEEELQKLKNLSSTWGAFQLVNHGIPTSTLDIVLELTREFFALPLEEKQKYARLREAEWDYMQMQGYGNDRMNEGQAFNWVDRLLLVLYPDSLRNQRMWPDESLPNFRKVVDDYVNGLVRIREILFKAVKKMFNLPEDNLMSKHGREGFIVSRFNYYPKSPYPDRILGARPHSDTNLFTILLVDKEVEGLHIEKDDQWYIVPIIPNALVINPCDMIEILTNGRVKSPVHRVVTNPEQDRISIFSSIAPPANTEIGPLKELIDDEHPKRYPHLKHPSKMTADYFAHGKILIKEIRKYGPDIVKEE